MSDLRHLPVLTALTWSRYQIETVLERIRCGDSIDDWRQIGRDLYVKTVRGKEEDAGTYRIFERGGYSFEPAQHCRTFEVIIKEAEEGLERHLDARARLEHSGVGVTKGEDT